MLRAVLYLASSLFCGAAFSSPLHWFWLPEQASLQGAQIDRLFNLIFWITAVIFVAVELTLAIFRVRYRKKDGSAATYTSGNRSLEVVWTVIPALILVTLTFMSRSVRSSINGTKYEDRLADESAFDVMVMPEKFRWNISYPGPDGRLGTAGGSPGSQPAPSFAPARHPGEAPLEGCRSQLFPAGDADQAGCASQQLGSR
ncbi:MAG: cytochrome c oxidase subunit II transmembrane domain-containing protein, partial [Acidobacteriota bacterium]